jgi:ABC-2 type transport system permease protein
MASERFWPMSGEVLVRTSEPPRLSIFSRARELWGAREVLANLARKELKVRYKSSVLGVLWSMLNPILYLAVFSLVFTVFLESPIKDYPVYLLSGLLAWTLFSTSLQGATVSVVANAELVPKVAFPREILPLAAVRAQTVNFLFQAVVLMVFMVVIGYPFLGPGLLLVPAALIVLLLFVVALGFATAALNVRYRDTGHLIELALLAWFWSTPIVYPAKLVQQHLGPWFRLYLMNPVANVVLAFQRGLYGGNPSNKGILLTSDLSWYWIRLGAVGLGSLVLLFMTWRVYFRMSGDFAEEL